MLELRTSSFYGYGGSRLSRQQTPSRVDLRLPRYGPRIRNPYITRLITCNVPMRAHTSDVFRGPLNGPLATLCLPGGRATKLTPIICSKCGKLFVSQAASGIPSWRACRSCIPRVFFITCVYFYRCLLCAYIYICICTCACRCICACVYAGVVVCVYLRNCVQLCKGISTY